jgi:diguanylate cyclase (GGDEF)-like protein/PAS domain S-box-containing protein
LSSDLPSGSRRRIEWLIAAPVFGALALVWITLASFTLQERATALARVKGQLGATVAMLADFNELAEVAGSDIAARASQSRGDAIWRALLQYPTASIWVERDGVLSAGQPPPGNPNAYLQVEDARSDFIVHAAMPLADVLASWRRAAWEEGGVLLALSAALFLLGQLLIRALRERAAAEREAAAEAERATQLAFYHAQLEHTVTERTADLEVAKSSLEKELGERKAAEAALREHDALLNAVTRSAAELLGARHEEGIAGVLELIGQTLSVSRVQLAQITTDSAGHLRSSVRHEWCAPGAVSTIDNPALRDFDLSVHFPRALGPAVSSGAASFFVGDISGPYRGLFEQANMRSFLQLPVTVEEKLWGSLNFIDASQARRDWSWAESDTLKTLAGLIGVAIARAQYVKELADANMIVQNSPTILYRLKGEPSLPLIYVSHNITKFGHDPGKLVGAPNWSEAIINQDDAPKVRAAMARALEKDAQAATIEFRLRTGDGAYRWVENRYTPVRDKEGRLSEVEGIIIDVTERKAAEEKIAQLARTDALTGLANRATFVDRLRHAFAASRRGAAGFAVLYIDLDHFKEVNDTLGHPTGDALLREVADRLRSQSRGTDLVARLGGDEFAILQSDVGEPAHAGVLAEKILRSVAAPYLIEGNKINISASIGICPYNGTCQNPDVMLAQADLALYRSKDEGRNQYHFHTQDLDQQVLERVSLAEDLRKALDQGQLELYYQPQVELVSGKITGMEALLRWHHPQRGLLIAGAFISLAEKAGLMTVLGKWVIGQACRQMRAWRDEGLAPPLVSINLSVSQLKSGRELVRCVEEALQRSGIEASCLEFDVTEATLAQVTLMQSDALQQLRLLGARIAIDDFGTEYSSFEYLRTYRVSQLKIAQSFVRSATTDPERAATIRAIMNLARELEIGVIAEGVETEEQRRMLAATGSATLGQGHYFSEAVGAPRANELLRQGGLGPIGSADDAAHVERVLTAQKG